MNYSNIQIKVTGIGESNHETALHCCAYIVVDGAVTYINGNKSADCAEKVTYASIPSDEEAA